tara:strand:- start:39 stop:185 length:147 start_codon:yes stop_codon:yes gene_type:complete
MNKITFILLLALVFCVTTARAETVEDKTIVTKESEETDTSTEEEPDCE